MKQFDYGDFKNLLCITSSSANTSLLGLSVDTITMPEIDKEYCVVVKKNGLYHPGYVYSVKEAKELELSEDTLPLDGTWYPVSQYPHFVMRMDLARKQGMTVPFYEHRGSAFLLKPPTKL